MRELANIVERLAIMCGTREIGERDLASVVPLDGRGASLPDALPDPASLDEPLSDALDLYERTLISRALSSAGGNVAEAARRLQTDRPNLYRRMRRLGITWGDA